MDSLPFRLADGDDVPKLVRLKKILFESWPGETDYTVEDDYDARLAVVLGSLMDSGTYTMFVLDREPGDRTTGLAAMGSVTLDQILPAPGVTGIRAYIGDMCVEKPFRGRGIGSAMLQRLLEFAESRDAFVAKVSATPGSIELYERFGFVSGDGQFPNMRMRLNAGGVGRVNPG